MLDDPQGQGSQGAGRVAAPLFAKIANQIIPYLGLIDGEIYTINTNDFLSLVPHSSNITNNVMPNLTGLSLRDALNSISYIVSNNNAKIMIQGEGYITDFSPEAGTSVTNDSIIRLSLKAPTKEQENK